MHCHEYAVRDKENEGYDFLQREPEFNFTVFSDIEKVEEDWRDQIDGNPYCRMNRACPELHII